MRTLESFVESPLAGTIGWALIHSLWEGAAISALLAMLILATRSARVRYAAACAAMVAMVTAFAITIYRLMPESAQSFPRFRTAVPFSLMLNAAAQAGHGRAWLSILSSLAPWLAPFWIGGVFLLSLQRLMSCFAVRRLRGRGVCLASEEWHGNLARLAAQLRISRPVCLLESCFAEIPMVLGHLRPVILVPVGLLANLPSEQVETILLHELAHIRRCDYLVNALQRIVESVLFYHPAVWWISKVIRTERENYCDDVVVSISQHANQYALALAALERGRTARHQAAVAATGGTLVKRIRRLLYPKAPSGIWAPIASATIFAVTAAVSFAAWQPRTSRLAALDSPVQAAATAQAGNMDVKAKTGGIIDAEENTAIDDPAETGASAKVRADLKTSENLSAEKHLAETRRQSDVIVAENGDSEQRVQVSGATIATPLDKWLAEDVVYIIRDEERDTFLHLNTDEEREQFIQAFWERRNPTPGAADNKFKDEHYRRIAYCNEHFGTPSGKAGWQTDRGHLYIVYGPPNARSESTASQNGNEFADRAMALQPHRWRR